MVSAEEKQAVLSISVPSWSTPSQDYINAIYAGHNPTIDELIDLCTALHASQIRVHGESYGLSELDYQLDTFEGMGDSLFIAKRKLQDAMREAA